MQQNILNQDRFWFSIFALYFASHVILRSSIGGALGLDEAETLLQGQSLSWGYGPQLPLYAWLQWLVFHITGTTIFGLSLLKNTILFLTVIAIYVTLRSEYVSKPSGFATLSLLLLPQISWEAQRDLTHSVLVNFCSASTLACVWCLSKQRRPYLYIGLGAVMACGLLSKYNYGIVLLSLFVATFYKSETRRVFISLWFIGAICLTLALIWKPYLWIFDHMDIAFSKARKLGIVENSDRFMSMLKGLFSLTLASLSFITPLAITIFGLWARYREKNIKIDYMTIGQFLLRFIIVSLVLTTIMILASNATNVKDRWLQPILIFSAPAIFLWIYPRLSSIGERRYVQICLGISALIIVLMIPYSILGRSYRAAPFDEIAAEIKKAIPERAIILSDNWISGNLLYADPSLNVISADLNPRLTKADYLIWNAEEKPRLPIDEAGIKIIEAPFKFERQEKLRIAIARIVD